MSSKHDPRGDEKRSSNASTISPSLRGANQSTSNADQHASIDYQGLAAESAAATASAAVAAAGGGDQRSHRQHSHHHQNHQQIQHQQHLQLQQQQQQQQQYAQGSKQSQLEASTPTTDAESASELESSSTVSQALAHLNNMKNPHRIKLSSQDVKLILFLIVEIKPFKYVGNRALSQTKKWEIIQNKYYDLKFRENNDTNFIIPTVRTLQRQLAGAVKKAQKQRTKERAGGFDRTHTIPQTLPEIDADDYYNFRNISPDSPQEQLESALLDLHELSDKIKELKSQSNNLVKVSYQPRAKTLLTDATLDDENGVPSRVGASGGITNTVSRDATSQLDEISGILSHGIFNLKQELENDSSVSPKHRQTVELLESVFTHTNEMRALVARENEVLNKQINKLISDHLAKIESVKSSFNAQQLELVETITDSLREDFKHNGKSKIILEKLDSIKGLLN